MRKTTPLIAYFPSVGGVVHEHGHVTCVDTVPDGSNKN